VQGDPVPEALALAAQLAGMAPVALRNAKRVINHGIGKDVRTGVKYEEEAWTELFSTEDQKEGMKAFLEKRKPVFKGK
jgi:enoyl-CoA hydratase